MFKLNPQLAADTIPLGDLPLCQVLLVNDSQYPWLILVPRLNSVEEIYQLDDQAGQQLQKESLATSRLLMSHFDGDKFNLAALGNVVPQLHIHHIVRFKTDPAWPKPVWGTLPALPYSSEDLSTLSTELKTLLSAQTDFIPC